MVCRKSVVARVDIVRLSCGGVDAPLRPHCPPRIPLVIQHIDTYARSVDILPTRGVGVASQISTKRGNYTAGCGCGGADSARGPQCALAASKHRTRIQGIEEGMGDGGPRDKLLDTGDMKRWAAFGFKKKPCECLRASVSVSMCVQVCECECVFVSVFVLFVCGGYGVGHAAHVPKPTCALQRRPITTRRADTQTNVIRCRLAWQPRTPPCAPSTAGPGPAGSSAPPPSPSPSPPHLGHGAIAVPIPPLCTGAGPTIQAPPTQHTVCGPRGSPWCDSPRLPLGRTPTVGACTAPLGVGHHRFTRSRQFAQTASTSCTHKTASAATHPHPFPTTPCLLSQLHTGASNRASEMLSHYSHLRGVSQPAQAASS